MPPIEQQQYYVLSAIETNENTAHLFFATENVENKVLNVSHNLNEAWLSERLSYEETDLIYIEKEKIDPLVFSDIEKGRYVKNSREHRKKLGLKYKDEVLQRVEGLGVEEDYILLLERAEEKHLGLPFYSGVHGACRIIDLREASIHEAPFNTKTVYLKRSTVDLYATPFPDGSKVLLNTVSNLKGLGLEYQDGVLQVKEALEGAEEEAPKEKEAEETPKVSWLKIGLDALNLGINLRKAYEQSQPKPKSRKTNLNILAAEIHLVNKEKGFWDKERNVGEMLMLVSSELGEAMEAHRKGKSADWIGYQEAIEGRALMSKEEAFEHCIKDSFEDEIADAVIRLLDLAAGLNINLDKHIEAKLAYNRSRDRFHGKEY